MVRCEISFFTLLLQLHPLWYLSNFAVTKDKFYCHRNVKKTYDSQRRHEICNKIYFVYIARDKFLFRKAIANIFALIEHNITRRILYYIYDYCISNLLN